MTVTVKQLRDAWLRHLRSTAPANRKRVEAGLTSAYQNANLSPPSILWAASPLEGIAAAVQPATCEKNELFTVNRVFSGLVGHARGNLNRDIIHSVSNAQYDFLNEANSAAEQIYTSVSDISDAVAAELDIAARVIGENSNKRRTADMMLKLISQSVAMPQDAACLFSLHCADRLLQSPAGALIRSLVLLTEGGWYWLFENLAIVTERPCKLLLDEKGRPHSRDQPAIEYPDGFRVYCRHGLRIPHEALNADSIEWDHVESAVDDSLKNALAEVKGEAWSQKNDGHESEEERAAAALATRRLGGIDALRGLIEDK